MRSVSIIGCGYTGTRLAQRWHALGARVTGFATRRESLDCIAATGATARPLNLDADADASVLDVEGQIVYYLVPPAPAGAGDARLQRFLCLLAGVPGRVIYISTTGVYGDQRGGRVDEETATTPLSERAMRRVAAELALAEWAERCPAPWSILRVPGIYGPGRLPLERLRRREPAIIESESSPANRIHVTDLVTACVAAGLSHRSAGRIYNVTDGSDDSPTAFLQRVARLANLPPPPLLSRAEAETRVSASAWSFLRESRRVDNRRMLVELGVELAFHDLDAGIRASL